MNIIEIIDKKRLKYPLSKEEIDYFIDGYTLGTITDYQASALCMAICINGMNDKETIFLTDAMIRSGEIIDLSKIKGIKVDKHSTGGVSDTTSIALVPLLASAGLKVAKMSGRGLGHTGGTLDKLSVFEGIRLERTQNEIIDLVNSVGGIILSQTGNFVPADKKLYALRDTTATIQSIPLIASSVMSKKIASNNDIIALDIKVGEGAFMKDEKSAVKLAKLCIKIGKHYGKKVCAILSNMDIPLGDSVGCELEVQDAIGVLKGQNGTLNDLVYVLFERIVELANITDNPRLLFDNLITSGKALNKLKDIVSCLGGSTKFFNKKLKYSYSFTAQKDGYINDILPKELGLLVSNLGGGRIKEDDDINLKVGIRLKVHKGDFVHKGDVLAELYDIKKKDLEYVKQSLSNIILISDTKPILSPLIIKIIN